MHEGVHHERNATGLQYAVERPRPRLLRKPRASDRDGAAARVPIEAVTHRVGKRDRVAETKHLTGGFRGGGESARLYKVKNESSGKYEWYAQTKRGGAGNQVRAEGRCYYYQQWDL